VDVILGGLRFAAGKCRFSFIHKSHKCYKCGVIGQFEFKFTHACFVSTAKVRTNLL
jgi:hypothetical protein